MGQVNLIHLMKPRLILKIGRCFHEALLFFEHLQESSEMPTSEEMADLMIMKLHFFINLVRLKYAASHVKPNDKLKINNL